MNQFELVIVGGGLTAARAIASYREAGGQGTIALLSEDSALPYHRPPLSKRFLRGETTEPPLVEDASFYEEHGVELVLGTRATALDPEGRAVSSADGGRFGYERLLIATGATPRRLDVPGTELDGVFSLRTLADSEAIRDAAKRAGRAVVIGAGFIGMEVAASLRSLGLEVTIVEPTAELFGRLGSRRLSDELAELYREQGVEVAFGEHVARFVGTQELEAVETASGRRIEADLAVVGIGVVPATGFLEGSGLELENGIVVDERFESNLPGVFAAGDVANFHDPLFDRRRRIEHWSNAHYQGTAVGRILAGESGGYDTVSSFFTEVFGVTLKVFGDVSRFDEIVAEGSLAEGEFVAHYGENGRLTGALTVGQSEEAETSLRELIAAREPFASTSAIPGSADEFRVSGRS
jgi:NADPH-dependent 2,4-dienoyl-CoA reductase/sulfur reductase-like enzyme